MQSCGGITMGWLWVYCGVAVGLLWGCYGVAMGLLWVYCGVAMGLLWDCYGIAVGLFYVGHIVAADAFPSAVVEEGDVVAIDTANFVAVRVAGVPP